MKPGAAEAADKGARPQDGIQAKPEKIRSSLKNVKKDTGKPEKLKFKPLTGKVFYLDIPSNVISEKLGKDLKELGGVRMSRGKSLVEKAIKEQDLIPSGSILSNALSWGVKILHIDDVKNCIEQKKRELYLIKRAGSSSKDVGKHVTAQKSKTGRLKSPFIRVEDRSRQYRPFYLQLLSFPFLNYCVPKPYSPFEVDKKYTGQKQTQSKERNKNNSDKDCGMPAQFPQKDKKKRGYCECCGKKYEDLQTHLESERHRNFAQSTQYEVVDDIISKLSYEFVAYKDDETGKIKRTKCSTGYFSPIIGKITRADELKERLKKQRIALKTYSWKDTAMQALKLDRQPAEVQPNSVPIPTPVSASVCSVLCQPLHPSELKSKFRVNNESTKTDCSCTVKLREAFVSSNSMQPPLPKTDQVCTENLSPAFELFSREILEPDASKKNVRCFQEGMDTSYSHTQVTDFSDKDRNLLQQKRKLNSSVVLPAKCLKKADANPTFVKKRHDLCDNHQQMQHNVFLEAEVSDTALNKELNASAASTAHSSPSGKLHRRVKLNLRKNKRETQKQDVELRVKNSDGLSVPEEKRSTCSSSLQTLLELFQASERNSEFGGSSSYTEKKCSMGINDTCEGQNANVLWSLFSSSSSSSFFGF
ncbi:protein DBF4 homolog A isoform X3 [Pyrgilauda ruficollis]|uniref:protein DBF4 homolog A isoform X3 n=1 Tax=Pyrgilauda ruficollis TaxID=221976 RepID=UPI001B85EA47|nr:protein DBF4 homolog A isoform X3 [Pyrgilauda ruficollis]